MAWTREMMSKPILDSGFLIFDRCEKSRLELCLRLRSARCEDYEPRPYLPSTGRDDVAAFGIELVGLVCKIHGILRGYHA
jgi:hypothetical protein